MQLDLARLDPELKAAYDRTPINLGTVTRENIAAIRAAMRAQRPAPSATALKPERMSIPASGGRVDVCVYRRDRKAVQPAIVWIHGGGYILGNAEDDRAREFAEMLPCTVFSVDYRLAPEHPFPAGPEDCIAVLNHVVQNAKLLNVDPKRVAIGGASAGGGMAAGVALMNRDRGGPAPCFQLLIYPMIDNLHATDSGQFTNHPVWNQGTSFTAWDMYLDGRPGADASPYAAAARATDLSGLPPAYVCVGNEDLFRDEDVAYAQRLAAAGVPCELSVFPGVFHGAENFYPWARVSQRMRSSILVAIKDGLAL